MNTKVTTKPSGEVTVGTSLDAWGPAPVIDEQDAKIPKLLTIQGTSKAFNGKNLGMLMHSISGKTIGGMGVPLEVIPIYTDKEWQIFDCSTNEPTFKRSEPVTTLNNKAPWTFTEDGRPYRRDRTLIFYVLLVDEIKEGKAVPYQLCFKRTSSNGGKKLNTLMHVSNRGAGLPPAGTVINVDTKKVEKYAVTDIEPSRPTTEAELAVAFKWFKIVSAGDVTVHEVEEKVDLVPIAEMKQDGMDF